MIVLDATYFLKTDNGALILRGWSDLGGKDALSACADVNGQEIPCLFRRVPRPDVIASRIDLTFPDDLPGFEIRIPDLTDHFPMEGDLTILLSAGTNRYSVYQRDGKQLCSDYKNFHYLMNLDSAVRRGDEVRIRGWCINFTGKKTEVSLVRLNQEEVPVKEIHINKRSDVAREFGVTTDMVHAFSIDILRTAVTDPQILLCVADGTAETSVPLDLSRIDREARFGYRLRRLLGRGQFAKNRAIIKEKGLRRFVRQIYREAQTREPYERYYKDHAVTKKEWKLQRKTVLPNAPFFSIVVPLYETPKQYLKDLVDSVLSQSYGKFELCLADGSADDHLREYLRSSYGNEERIRYRHLKKNAGISGNTNEAIAMAQGDFIVFADHDDVLEKDALYLAAEQIASDPAIDVVYTDEDLMDADGVPFYPHFKPDFNLEFLRCINYICHLVAVRKSLLDRTGLLRPECDGAQDFDLLLRISEKTDRFSHIPKVLYHWRSHPQSTAGNQDSKQYAIDASIRALRDHYERLGIDARVEYTGTFIVLRSTFAVKGDPKVSILIPNKDHIADLTKCVTSIAERSTWKNVEILVIENNSEDPATMDAYEDLCARFPQIRILHYEGGFNYSAINNFGASQAAGDYLLLLNNDTEVISPDFLERMLGLCQRPEAGIVGAKLYYGDDTIQHAGIVVGIDGFAGHIQTGYSKEFTGYLGRLITTQEISAVTGACMLVKRSVYEELSGLDESFSVALNDVDFCLRARKAGYRVYFTPDAELYHFESKSRGYEDTPEKKARFDREVSRFKERYQDLLAGGDPYYNPNLTLSSGDCSLKEEDV